MLQSEDYCTCLHSTIIDRGKKQKLSWHQGCSVHALFVSQKGLHVVRVNHKRSWDHLIAFHPGMLLERNIQKGIYRIDKYLY